MTHEDKHDDWILSTAFGNDAVTWKQFRDFSINGLGIGTNGWALSWRTKYDFLKVSLTIAPDEHGNDIEIMQILSSCKLSYICINCDNPIHYLNIRCTHYLSRPSYR